MNAADPWPLPLFSSEPKAVLATASQRPIPPNAAVVILNYDAHFRYLADGRLLRTYRSVYRVINDSGARQFTQVLQPWQGWRTSRPVIQVRVITADGTAHRLDANTIAEAGVPTELPGVYSDLRVLTAPLPAVAAGAVVEVGIEWEDRVAKPPGSMEEVALPVGIPLQFLRVAVEAPLELPLHEGERRLPKKLDRRDSTGANTRLLELTGSDVTAVKPLPLGPPESAGDSAILFSDVPDWQAVAHWYYEVSERQIGVVSPTADANADPTARLPEIESILSGIQKQVRYTGVEFGSAALEPRSPAETLDRGYGDCKDKAVLLVSRLRRAGIAASLALLTPHPNANPLPTVPGIEAFSHAIVNVPGKHPLWIDPSDDFAPARRLPWADQGRLTLIIDPGTRDLTPTPVSNVSDERSLQDCTLTLHEDGHSRLECTHEDTGGVEDIIRPIAFAASQVPENQRDNVLVGLLRTGGKLKSVDWGTPRDLGKPARFIVVSEDVPGTGTSGDDLNAAIDGMGGVPIQMEGLLETLNAEKNDPEVKSRTQEYWLRSAFSAEYRYRVVPPKGFRLRDLPVVADLPYGPLMIHREASPESDGSVRFVYRMEVKRQFAPDEARKLLDAARNAPVADFHLEFAAEGPLLMSEGRWTEGIATLRRGAELPSAAVPDLLRYAGGLMEAGFRDAAIAVCRKAIALDPRSARAYSWLGFLYQHDAAGRLDVPGTDLTEAEKALRKALELQPDDQDAIARLSSVLEWKDPLERYADSNGTEESIKLLEKISADLPGLQAADRLPMALFFARRFAELASFYSRPESAMSLPEIRLAGVAAESGPPAAIREARRLLPDDQRRNTTLRGAGELLVGIGEYARAADVWRAAGSAVSQSAVELIQRTHRGADLRFSQNGPVAAVEHYILAISNSRLGLNDSEMLAVESRATSIAARRKAIFELLSQFQQIDRMKSGLRLMGEMAVSTLNFTAEGSDAAGYRVRFSNPVQNGASKTIAWVVKRGDSYKVLGLASDQPAVGGEALSLAERGDLAAARRWLDWEREETFQPSSADPLAGEPFLKLWPPKPGPPEREQILAAAATLMVSGPNFQKGNDTLAAVYARAEDGPFRDDVDLALACGLYQNGQPVEAAPKLRRVQQRYPSSEGAFQTLGWVLLMSGRPDEALELSASVKPQDDLFLPAQHVKVWALQAKRDYGDAMNVARAACENSPKVTWPDCNTFAWLTLFVPGTASGLDAATKANLVTGGGNRDVLLTLASVQADAGHLKEARDSLVRYLSLFDPPEGIDDGAHYLFGRIAEGIGLDDIARDYYNAIPQPKDDDGVRAYDLAQIRLKMMREGK